MAFGNIGWDGYGIVTYCDGTTDTAGGSWAELGGGDVSYNTDTFLTGAGSIGSQYANKTGYSYYSATTSFDFTSGGTGSGTEKVANEYFYIWINMASSSALEDMSASGDIALAFVAGSGTGDHRYWTLAAGDNDNGWASGWKLFVIDPNKAGTVADEGTYDAGDISMWGLWLDVSASVRADSIFIDQISVASGVRAYDGTGTLQDIIDECVPDYAGNTVIGSYAPIGRFNYLIGKTIIGDSTNQTESTTLNAVSQINGYITSEYYNGSSWVTSYPADSNEVILEKHSSYDTSYNGTNTSMFGTDNTALGIGDYVNFSKDSGAEFTFSGGTFEKLNTVTHDSDWDVQNATFSDCKARAVSGGTFSYNTIDDCEPITLSGGTAESNTIKNHKTNGIIVSSLTNIPNYDFQSGGTGHAVDRGNVTEDLGETWSCTESGYALQGGTAGNRTLLVNVSVDKTLTINIDSGASTPTYYNTGSGTVDIVEGQVTVEITNVIVGSRVRVDTIDGNGDISTNLISEEATTSTVSTNVTFSGLDYTAVSIRVRKSSGGTKYLPYSAGGTITDSGMSAAANQVVDTIAN